MKKNLYKYLLTGILSFMVFSSNVFAFQKTDISIKYNTLTQPLTSDVINKDGYILIPVRNLIDVIGGEVKWDEIFRSVTLKIGNDELIIYTDTNDVMFNKKIVKMPTNIENIEGIIYVPVNFICELFGYNVTWNSINKQLSISNEFGEYLFLQEEDLKQNTITLDEAVKKAKENNSNFKNLEDTYDYMENLRKNLRDNLDEQDPYNLGENMFPTDGSSRPINTDGLDYLDNSLTILKNIKSTDNQLKNQEINKKIIEDSIELSIISSVIAIKNTELNISLTEKNIEIGKINIENLEAKYEYGMVSKKQLETAKNNQKNLEVNLEALKIGLKNQQENLNSLLGTKKDTNIDINLKADYNEFYKINLEEYIGKKVSNDLSVQIAQNDIDVAQYNLDTYVGYSETEKTKLKNDLNVAKRKLNDTKENLDKKIRSSYSNLQKLVEQEEVLNDALKSAISDYEIMVSNYKSGKVTLYEVEQAKLAILKAEKDIEENKINFYSTLYTFYKPYLL